MYLYLSIFFNRIFHEFYVQQVTIDGLHWKRKLFIMSGKRWQTFVSDEILGWFLSLPMCMFTVPINVIVAGIVNNCYHWLVLISKIENFYWYNFEKETFMIFSQSNKNHSDFMLHETWDNSLITRYMDDEHRQWTIEILSKMHIFNALTKFCCICPLCTI